MNASTNTHNSNTNELSTFSPFSFPGCLVGIEHELYTMKGDDKDWKERVARTGWGVVDKHFIYFTDLVGLTW